MQPNVKLQDDASENSDDSEEFQVNDFEKSDIVEKARTDDDFSDEPNIDNGEYNTYYSSGGILRALAENRSPAGAGGRKTIPAAGAGGEAVGGGGGIFPRPRPAPLPSLVNTKNFMRFNCGNLS